MLKHAISCVVVARLVLAPWAGAEEPSPRLASAGEPSRTSASLRDAAVREATRLSQAAPRGPMPTGLKWTGMGLLIGSGLPVFAAAFGDCLLDDATCRDQRRAAYAAAGVMAGTGVALLVIGHAKRSPALPTIALRDGGVLVQQRILF